ncbi:WD40-repeat-containing domain protein [Cyathus striatus]|nr:WD40-repeat-containing domain protein [Cyathus striatus]
MPAQLPGFYFDEARNRYFPLSSKPPQSSPSQPYSTNGKVTNGAPQGEHSNRGTTERKGLHFFRASEYLRVSHSYERRAHLTHEILCSHVGSTSRATRVSVPTFGNIKSFGTVIVNGQCRRFIGDNRGWLYTCTTPEPSNSGIDTFVDYDTYWAAEMNIQPSSEISSISTSESHCVATCFGADGTFAVQDLNDAERTFVLTFNDLHDIWTSCLTGKSLLLGGNGKAVYIHDIDVTRIIPKILHTGSDVFAITQKDHLIYTGARNGNIERFDIRLGKHRGQQLIPERFGKNQSRTSVLHLELIGESQVLVSHMNGELACYDLRFSARDGASLIRYEGHVNSYTPRLGISTDLTDCLLFAAGQDHRVRGWSLNTGEPLQPRYVEPSAEKSGSSRNRDTDLFHKTFDMPVETMQLSIEGGNKYLWVASGKELFQYHLGQRNF